MDNVEMSIGSFKITASVCMFCLFASIPLYKFCGVSIVKREGLVRRKKNADAHEVNYEP